MTLNLCFDEIVIMEHANCGGQTTMLDMPLHTFSHVCNLPRSFHIGEDGRVTVNCYTVYI